MSKSFLDDKSFALPLKQLLDREEKGIRTAKFRLWAGIIIGTIGYAVLWYSVNFWCALGVLLALWANNIANNTKPG